MCNGDLAAAKANRRLTRFECHTDVPEGLNVTSPPIYWRVIATGNTVPKGTTENPGRFILARAAIRISRPYAGLFSDPDNTRHRSGGLTTFSPYRDVGIRLQFNFRLSQLQAGEIDGNGNRRYAFEYAKTYFTVGNEPPVAINDVYAIVRNQTLNVTAGVLQTDADPEDSPLTAMIDHIPANWDLNSTAYVSLTYPPTWITKAADYDAGSKSNLDSEK